MNKNLSIISQNNKLMLKKSKSLMTITNNILSNDDWMQRLWDWAEDNDISDLEWVEKEDFEYLHGIPRDKKELLNLIDLDLSENQLKTISKEIGNLINLTGLWLTKNKLFELPKEIGTLTNLTHLLLSENQLLELPKEIGNLINLTEFWIYDNQLSEFPKEIVNLTNLTKFDFEDNPNLILTEEQKEWISELIKNGCDVATNDKYQYLHGEVELQRRYDYLDEFNIGREVPITPEMLDEYIPSSITNKLANGEITFEEYLDEASDYLLYLDREKFNTLVQKLYDRSYDLGTSFERNISFVSYVDNKLTWTSTAFGEDKKLLITHWGLINMFVKEIFGFETKIINIAVSVE